MDDYCGVDTVLWIQTEPTTNPSIPDIKRFIQTLKGSSSVLPVTYSLSHFLHNSDSFFLWVPEHCLRPSLAHPSVLCNHIPTSTPPNTNINLPKVRASQRFQANPSWVWWHTMVICTWEVEAGGSEFKIILQPATLQI